MQGFCHTTWQMLTGHLAVLAGELHCGIAAWRGCENYTPPGCESRVSDAQAANAHLVMEAVLAGELHGGVAAQRSALHRAVRGYAAADTAEVGQLAIAQAALPHRHRQLPPAANGQRLPTLPRG